MSGIDLETIVIRVLDENRYMVLGTADEAGVPWVSPVFYAMATHRQLFWVSSPEVTHSRNLSARPEVSIVVFDSRAPVGAGGERAVYLAATAAQVAGIDVDRSLADISGFARHGARVFTAPELRPPAPYRLYRATVTGYSVLCPRPAGVPCAHHGRNYDHRTQVHLSDEPG